MALRAVVGQVEAHFWLPILSLAVTASPHWSGPFSSQHIYERNRDVVASAMCPAGLATVKELRSPHLAHCCPGS